MRAVLYDDFGGPVRIDTVDDPAPTEGGVVVEVRASGICRSDWHGWQGHDPDIRLPHVPGHELAGVVAATGRTVARWRVGDRVTVPFACGCGACPHCLRGDQQVCDHQFQPGFTHWGSFAEFVALDYADINLVELPEGIDFVSAASLGCRFITAFRALVDQGRLGAGEWLAVYGCGGVGLSAIMIARALGASPIAVDIDPDKLEFAASLGAATAINARQEADVAAAVRAVSDGGAHVSIDALGSPDTCFNAVASLRKRGRHVQVGLMAGEHARLPMDKVIAMELEILGSHGMQAHRYGQVLDMIAAGRLNPDRLVGATIPLDRAPQALMQMGTFPGLGITVVNDFKG